MVDPETDFRAELVTSLKALRWNALESSFSLDILERFSQTPPALVVLDLTPNSPLAEFLNMVARKPIWNAIPIVALAGEDLNLAETPEMQARFIQIVKKENIAPDRLIDDVIHEISRYVRRGGDPNHAQNIAGGR